MEPYIGKVSGGRALSHTGSSVTADSLLQGQPGDTRAEDPLRFPGNGIHPRTNTEGPLGGGLEAAPGPPSPPASANHAHVGEAHVDIPVAERAIHS